MNKHKLKHHQTADTKTGNTEPRVKINEFFDNQ